MLKAGKMVLLLTALCAFLGAAPQLNAQEKLIAQPLAFLSTHHKCSMIDEYIVTHTTSCEDTPLTQTEIVLKAESKENSDTVATFSYATEPTYYVPPTPTPTGIPTLIPSPTPPSTEDAPQQLPQDNVPANAPSLNPDAIFDLINGHRAQLGKPAFLKDDALCSLAKARSLELDGELFGGKGYLHSGLYNRNLPYWITEDAKWGSNESGTVQWWLHSPIHRAAIEGDYTYSCGACNGSMCSQLFTSYTPKAGLANSAVSETTK